MKLNECEFRNKLTTCCIGKKHSIKELSDIQNTTIQFSKLRWGAFEQWKFHTDCYYVYTSKENFAWGIAKKRKVPFVDSPSCNKNVWQVWSQLATCSKETIKTLEQCVKYVQS